MSLEFDAFQSSESFQSGDANKIIHKFRSKLLLWIRFISEQTLNSPQHGAGFILTTLGDSAHLCLVKIDPGPRGHH